MTHQDDLSGSELTDYVERVRHYYDDCNGAYLRNVGTSFQAGRIYLGEPGMPPESASNLFLADQAGIQPGDHVLDAGCGVCGPSIDIASFFEGVTIEGVTISPVQVATAQERIKEAGLEERVRVHLGDFHDLPFPDNHFDKVIFLESSGYAYDRVRLFAGAYRVLKPGGTLYIKDIFKKEGELSAQEQEALAIMEEAFVYRAETLTRAEAVLREVGFQILESRELTHLMDPAHMNGTFYYYQDGVPVMTEFGALHARYTNIINAVTGLYDKYVGIRAVKPG